jgi:microcompartment protein CcmK/EutM
MYVGRVNGTVVATIKNDTFQGRKLLIVEKLDLAGLRALSAGQTIESRLKAKYDIAVDMVQAGMGDVVLVLDEGNSARQIVDREPNGAIRAVVVGIVDEVTLAEM